MKNYIELVIVSLLSPIVTGFFMSGRKGGLAGFAKLPKKTRQVIIGIVFGILAIVGTEWGIPINGAQVNCRDAAVLAAGLFFGGRAGIIAGLIGGIERYIAVAWGVGTYTRVACSVSTLLAGFYTAYIRKYMLNDKYPGWAFSFAAGIVMETFHLTMVFVTNMDTPDKALAVVMSCTAPMLIANAASLALSSLAVSLMLGSKIRVFNKKNVRLSETLQKGLLILIVITLCITTVFVEQVQKRTAIKQTTNTLTLAIDDVDVSLKEYLEKNIDLAVEAKKEMVKNRHIGEGGIINVVSKKPDYEENTLYKYEQKGIEYYAMYRECSGLYILAMSPVSEVFETKNTTVYVNMFMEILVFGVLYAFIYKLLDDKVVEKIVGVNGSLKKIREGELDEQVEIRSSREFSELSDGINSTVEKLKEYIDAAKKKIAEDLANAQTIQTSVLPNRFPAFLTRDDFDIYARMDTAKEVGGDFYDFYFTHRNLLHVLIADVSGKGIPAALFMMRARTELSNLTRTEHSVDEVFAMANTELCKGNQANMFVTAWQGGIDLETGVVEFACAGHNPPIVKHKDGKFEYIKQRANLVLGGMEGLPYRKQELKLEKGDILYLYTDGVTEATNIADELYGEDRLLERLNAREFINMKDLCDWVYDDVMAFTGEADQFDDITMLAFKYADGEFIKSGAESKALVPVRDHKYVDTIVSTSQVGSITSFAEEYLEELGCPLKEVMKINIAIDEIYSNIVNYAYPNGSPGPCRLEIARLEGEQGVVLTFVDSGIEYNPLLRDDPDVTLSAEERSVGGLGIFMVKKSMDQVLYDRKGGENILTIVKKF